jgi:hypothetical protein
MTTKARSPVPGKPKLHPTLPVLKKSPSFDLNSVLPKSVTVMSMRNLKSYRASYDSNMPALTQHACSQPISIAAKSPKRKHKAAAISTRFNEAGKPLESNKLGPGYYILPEVDRGPAFEFSSLQRFDSNYQDRIEREG